MQQHGRSFVRGFVLLVVAFAAASIGLLLGGGVTRANSPIDGIYRITETYPTFQSVTSTPCWATPMRVALSTDPPTLKTVFYDVQITADDKTVTFSKPGVSGTLFTAPLRADPVVAGQLPSYHVQDTRHATNPTSGNDYWWVDGRFLVHPASADIDLVWQFQDSPDHTGLCQTEINGSLTSAGTGASPGTGGGPVQIIIAVVVGGIIVTTITVGGWRWRNRRRAPLTPPGQRLAPKVPPRCLDVATRHDTELEILNSLRDARHELTEKLERAEAIHKNNIIKARMVIDLQIIQTVGGFTTDVALALRPGVLRHAAGPFLGEQDTWRPPGSISAQLSERIEQARQLARDLWGRFQTLGNQVEMLRGTVQEAIENVPAVRNAKQMWEYHMNRLGEMMADLPKAEALRSEISKLGGAIEGARGAADATEAAWRIAQRELSDAESAVSMAKNQLPSSYYVAAKDLQNAGERVAAMAGRSAEDTLRLTAETALQEARGEMAAAERASSVQLRKITDLQGAVEAKRGPVDQAWQAHQAAGTVHDNLVSNRDKLGNILTTQYSDLKAADITQQGKIAAQAEREVGQAQQQAQAQVGRELMERVAERERVGNDARAAQQLTSDLRIQAERQDSWNRQVGAVAGKVVKTVLTPITYPVGLLVQGWEWTFGSAQSPQEIVDLIVRGQTNIRILRSYLQQVEDRTFAQEQLVERLRTQVDACVKGVAVAPLSKPAQPSAPPASTPAG